MDQAEGKKKRSGVAEENVVRERKEGNEKRRPRREGEG